MPGHVCILSFYSQPVGGSSFTTSHDLFEPIDKMTTISTSKLSVTPPTQLQLALALAVVKGKPPGQSVKG